MAIDYEQALKEVDMCMVAITGVFALTDDQNVEITEFLHDDLGAAWDKLHAARHKIADLCKKE